ncbi:MAG: 3-oxoacyl-[acyl-carrier protein] reductase [uncultured Truepera sp.]|uniref:3-oxoacyl-[acyl-carrier protein] reductase n=1 Tax=uncultured Truepera sp. TaxID=543023 RepID=A0A6J4VPR3_9DEIN|nr:MAG: 3-oxoacyl-[acyl-carrier protein] reductase [uncultured Truepera sp.]
MGMLDNKVAFITGAASGIGAGTAWRFAQEGAKVALCDVMTEQGQALRDELESAGYAALYIDCDVSSPEAVERAVSLTVERFGGLDIVFANAGVNGVWAPIEELQPDEWERTFAINLRGTYLTTHFAVPHLKRTGGGSIIITSSVNGTRTFSTPGASAYSTTKAGQVAFMKMIALELGQHDIRCNAICPGMIHTNISQRTEQRHTDKIGIEVELPKGNPAVDEGEGDVTEVADTCLFLASDLSRHVSGVEIYVDGGASLLR